MQLALFKPAPSLLHLYKVQMEISNYLVSSRHLWYLVSMFMGNAFVILSSILVLNIVLSIYKVVKFVNFLYLVMTHDNLTLKTDSRCLYKISCGGSVKFYKTHGLLLCTFLVTYLLKEEYLAMGIRKCLWSIHQNENLYLSIPYQFLCCV